MEEITKEERTRIENEMTCSIFNALLKMLDNLKEIGTSFERLNEEVLSEV